MWFSLWFSLRLALLLCLGEDVQGGGVPRVVGVGVALVRGKKGGMIPRRRRLSGVQGVGKGGAERDPVAGEWTGICWC